MALSHRSVGELVTASMWNDIIDGLNGLTAQITVSGSNVGIGITTPARQLHVYGLGQTTPNLSNAGNTGGTVYVQSSGGGPGEGGAVVIGSGWPSTVFAGIKGLLTDGATNTIGDLAFSTRRLTSDAAMTEVMRISATGYLGVGTTTPTRTLHVYGLGQETANLGDAQEKGGTVYVQASSSGVNAGGAVVFGAAAGHFASVKGLLANAAGTTTGYLSFSTRRTTSDALLTESMRLLPSGILSVGLASDDSHMTAGVVIDQSTADDHILSLQSSSDVSHPFTTYATVGTYGSFNKYAASDGGLEVTGYASSGSKVALNLIGFTPSTDGTRSTAAIAPVMVSVSGSDGAGGGMNLAADKNLFVIRNTTNAKFIFDSDGDSHQDGTGWTAYDTVDDVDTLNLLNAHLTRRDDPIRSAFSQWLEQSREPLERLRLVTFNEDGHHFINMTKLTMLLTGAARQLGERVADLEGRLKALES
jgi:hypothetical protein